MTYNTLLQELRQLRLNGMADALAQQLAQPNTYDGLGFLERCRLLVQHEITIRDNRRLQRLLKQAQLRTHGPASAIDYQAARGLHRDTMAQLLQLD